MRGSAQLRSRWSLAWPRRLFVTLAIWACAALSQSAASALELGEAVVTSRLDEPLLAVIRVVDATPAELGRLRADIPQAEVFRRYGLDRPDFLTGATVELRAAADGSSVLELRSRRAVSEPVVTLLLAVDWGDGSVLREFNLVIDRPGYSAEAMPPVEVPRAAAVEGVTEVITVARGATLHGIALAVSRRTGVSLPQTMVSIYHANPAAFGATMNELRAGVELRIPDAATLALRSRDSAVTEVVRSIGEWRRRDGVAVVRDASTAGRVRLVAASGVAVGGGGSIAQPVQPEEPAPAADIVPDASAARIAELESRLLDERRRLEASQAELAQLRQRAAQPVDAEPEQPGPPVALAWLFAAAMIVVAALVYLLLVTRRSMLKARRETESLNRALAAAVSGPVASAHPERRPRREPMPSPEPAPAVATVAPPAEDRPQRTRSPSWFLEDDAPLAEEFDNKLDLARALMDMGTPVAARAELQDVLRMGIGDQRETARRLLNSIG